MSANRISDLIRSTYFPLFYSATIFLDQKAGEILSTFFTLEELLSAPVSATGVHLLESLDKRNIGVHDTCSNFQCSKAIVITCEERPGTVQLLERIKQTIRGVEAFTLLTSWTREDSISYEQVILDYSVEQEEGSVDMSSLGILEDLEKEPYERTANELKLYYCTTQVEIYYAPFLGVACLLDNLFITASKDSDQWKLLIDSSTSQVEGISQLSEPLRNILACIARNLASFCSCTRLRPLKTFVSGPLSKLVIEQFQRCSTRANEELKHSTLLQNILEEKDAYLLVVDRASILSESFHMNESLLDRIFSFYTRRSLDVVSSFSDSYATQMWKLDSQLSKNVNEHTNSICSRDELERIHQFCLYGESGQGILSESRLDREDSQIARKLLMSLVSVGSAEQSISIIRELLIHILQDAKDRNHSVDYDSCSLEELLQYMKETKTYDDKPLSHVYRLVWELAMIASTVLETSPLARLWNAMKRVMDNIANSEMNNSRFQSSSDLLLSLLDGIQSIVDSSLSASHNIQSVDLLQSILLLIAWVFLTPSFRRLESTEEDILVDTLVALMDEECKEWLDWLLNLEREEQWKDSALWELSNTFGFSRWNNVKYHRLRKADQDNEESNTLSELIRRLLYNLASFREAIHSKWHEEGDTMSLLFRRMISEFPDFRLPSLVHVIGKLKEIREEDSFGLKLEYIPPQYLGERLLSGLQRLRPFGKSSSGNTEMKTLIVFVIGGIRLSEIASVENFVKQFFSDEFDEILFGSTHLTTAMEMLYLCANPPRDLG